MTPVFSEERFEQPACVGDLGSIRGIEQANVAIDDSGLSVFLSARGRLLYIAKQILRNASEAEDVLQEVWIRWQTTDRSVVRDAVAFLATTTMRLAINVIQSARWRRETDIEPHSYTWADPEINLDLEADRRDALRNALNVLLEKLSPSERAAFVLREAFEYSYREIANILRMREANARQLVTRARRHLTDHRSVAVIPVECRRFMAAFAAAQEGSLTALEAFFAGSIHNEPEPDWQVAPIAIPPIATNHDSQRLSALDVVAA
jgi:RNA polymerase sigma factor (sigma-70 family)